MITEFGKTRSEISELGDLDEQFYENIFSIYKVNKHYVYNMLRQVTLTEGQLDENLFYSAAVTASSPWTAVSQKHYGTIKLWWLICIINNIKNPIHNAQPGFPIKLLKSKYIAAVLKHMNQQA